MAYFIPSNIQKRLLVFALSRLDILDKDSLNLDQLDIAWGRRSSVELRDVKLNVEVCDDRLYLKLQADSFRNYVLSFTFLTISNPPRHVLFAYELQCRPTSTEAA